MAEIVRSGIQSVDKGQNEGARSIGMTDMQAMFYVILPQAIKNAFPSIGNEFVVNIVEDERRKIEKIKEAKQSKGPEEVSKGIYAIIPIRTIHEKSGDVWSEYMFFNANKGTVIYDKTLSHCLQSPEIYKISEFQNLINKKGINNIEGAEKFKQFIIKYPDIYMEGINNEEQNQEEEEEEEHGQDY